MAKTVFVNGTVVTPEFLNSLQDLNFLGADVDGSYAPITNDSLSSAAGQIKPEWTAWRDTLKVSAGTGATVSYAGGMITRRDGTSLAISPGLLALPADGINFVFVDGTGAIATSTTRPAYGIPLAQVTTVAGAISGAVQDLRPRFEVKPRADMIRVFGGIGTDGAYNQTTGTVTLTGEKSYSSFNLAAGATINCSEPLYLKVAGNVTIAGTINIAPCVRGGQRHIGNYTEGTAFGFSGAGFAGATGINDTSPATYSYLVSPLGSGGCGGSVLMTVTGLIQGTRGGNGGGFLIIEAAGSITVSGTVIANGGNGDDHTVVGAMGGGAPPGGLVFCSGGSGGSGGLIWLKSLSSIAAGGTAQLSVQGGSGGLGYPSSVSSTAGGGGGGYIVCEAPSVNLTGANLNLTGGASPTLNSYGSAPGAAFGGAGGLQGQAGGNGQLITRLTLPV